MLRELKAWFRWLFSDYKAENAHKSEVDRAIQLCQNDAAAVEAIQRQISSIASNALLIQNEKATMAAQIEQQSKQIMEIQAVMDVMRADLDAKQKPNPTVRPHRWASFRDAVQERV